MKAPIFKSALLLIFVQILVITSAFAESEEFSKNLHKEYDANENTLLIIQNKFGDVDINNWDKDKVSIDVTITVDHKNEEKAKELIDYIEVKFSQTGNTIEAITTIDDKFSKWNTFTFNDNHKEFSIDYKVNVPKNIKLDLSSKYGNVFINEIAGHTKISVKYGNLKINKLTREAIKPYNEIYLSYSNGTSTIEECKWLNLTIKYSELNITDCKALIAITKYSDLYVDKASSIVCESKYDDYRLGKITNFVTTSAYTDFEIDEIYKKLEFDNRYGNLNINYVPANFEKISIENEYGSINIGIDPNASYKLNGYAKYADIDYANEGRISRIKESTSLQVEGLVGTDNSTKSIVEIETKYGSVNLE
ncbi:MAG: hypothetical protein PF485_04645 [Bacteroidales bacterium]|jgi:hypothetical protein|nr:hypothetical protein [Bacteroidales bacterium]